MYCLFGAVRSVHAFLRLARAIWWTGAVGWGLLWTSFYESTIISLFELLGWSFDSVLKRWEFFDLRNSGLGVALVCSTASTVAELCSDIQEVMDAGILGSKRMQFAESQLFGRTGRHWMKVLSAFAEGHEEKLGTKDLFFFNLFKQLLQNNIP